MSGRDEGYYGPSDGDLSKGCLALALVGVGLVVLASLCAFGVLA